MAGGGGQGESFLGDIELPILGGDSSGVEELEEAAGGEFGGRGAGEFGEGEDCGMPGAAGFVYLGGENGGGEEDQNQAHDIRVACQTRRGPGAVC